MKVYAKDDNVRKFIRHWPSGMAFNKDGVSDWPNDSWTKRRLAKGDITLEPPRREEVPQHERRRLSQQSHRATEARTAPSES